jgi:sugar lactone lactonase YvrE
MRLDDRMGKPALSDATRWQPPKATARSRQRHSETPVNLTVFDTPGEGPEDVALDAEGNLYTGLVDGRILKFTPDGRSHTVVAETGGRPLGIEIDPDGDLLICDARRGVLRTSGAAGGAVHTLVDRINGKPMMFCNNGTIASDGTTYFTDSSARFGIDHWKGELLAHTGTGRLFRRTPDGSVDLVADGFNFANGVALAPDESWLAIAETTGYSLDRIWLTGPKQGQREPFVTNLPGFPDNISTGSDGLIWVTLPSRRDTTLDLVLPLPPVLRKAVWALPEFVQPKERKTVWVQAFDLDGNLVHDLQTEHPSLYMVTGVRERDGRVWVGSLKASAIGLIDLR